MEKSNNNPFSLKYKNNLYANFGKEQKVKETTKQDVSRPTKAYLMQRSLPKCRSFSEAPTQKEEQKEIEEAQKMFKELQEYLSPSSNSHNSKNSSRHPSIDSNTKEKDPKPIKAVKILKPNRTNLTFPKYFQGKLEKQTKTKKPFGPKYKRGSSDFEVILEKRQVPETGWLVRTAYPD